MRFLRKDKRFAFYEEWLDFRGREKRRGWLPSHTWLTVRQSDGRVVGIINPFRRSNGRML